MSDLSVLQNPANQTISGTLQAPSGNQTISGMATPPAQTIGAISQSPVPGASPLNPMGTSPSTIIMPAAGVKTVMPNTTTAQSIAQQPTAASQTFKLGDGSVYDMNGNKIGQSAPTGNTYGIGNGETGSSDTIANGPTISTDVPSITTNSASLTSDTGYGDMMQLLNKNLSRMDGLFSNLSAYSSVSPEEQAQQGKVASDTAAMTALGYQAQGLYNPDNQSIAMPFLTGQAQNKLVGAGIQSQLDQSVLNYMQGNRQFAFNSASTMFDKAQQSLQTTLDVYTKAAPQNIGTNYNPTTGELNFFTRQPFTGAISVMKGPNIGPQKQLTPSGSPFVDPTTGDYVQGFIQNGSTPVMLNLTGANAGQINNSAMGGGLMGGSGLQGGGTSTGSLVSQNPNPNSVITTATGISYDMTSYASGNRVGGPATQAANINNTLQKLPAITNAASAQYAINSIRKNSPISGDMVVKASEATGVDPRMLIATMQAETQLGTDGSKGARGYNFGNVGNTDSLMASGGSKNFPDAYSGVLATAENLAHRTIQSKQEQAAPYVKYDALYNAAPTTLRAAIKPAPDGSAYIDQSELKTDALQLQAQSLSGRTGVPIKNSDEVKDIQGLNTAIANLNTTAVKFSQIAAESGIGGFGRNLTDPFARFFGTSRGNNVKAYQDNQEQLYQQVKTLATNSPRLSDVGLNLAQSALPQMNEFNHDTMEQGQLKVATTQRLLDNAVRTYLPNYKGSIIQFNGQFMVNDPQSNTPHMFPNYSAAQQFQQALSLTPVK